MKANKNLTNFNDLGLADMLLEALASEGYQHPTPIQADAIPHLLSGRDLLGIAQTGTGKTAAFALPILQRLAATGARAAPKSCRALVLSPTRELATQIAESFRTYGRHSGLRVAVVFGGVGHRPQIQQLTRGVDILVATPGRLLDHLDSANLTLARTEVFVLDEADQMLDMGFIQPIRRLVSKLPKERQSLFFSATMPREMAALAGELLRDPVRVAVAPVASTAERVEQRVMFAAPADKRALLTQVLRDEKPGRTLVFTRTKHGADRVVRQLGQDGIAAVAIHGNKSQSQRDRAMAGFRSGQAPILVATDIAARGIDVDGVTHVINFDLPNIPEAYVHRIGRTARAGADGLAISFCSPEERPFLRDIEKLTRQKIAAQGEAGPLEDEAPIAAKAKPKRSRRARRGGRPDGSQPNGSARRANAPRGGADRQAADASPSISALGFLKRPKRRSGEDRPSAS